MKIKIITFLVCTLFLASIAFPVTGNILKIDKPKISATGTLGDLDLDLAITSAFSNEVRIYLGTGAGGFSTKGDFSVGTFPAGITDGDFNSDGILDVATTNYQDSNVTLLVGDGTGDFSVSGNFTVGSEPLGIINEDFNSDGKKDIVVANSGSNKISVLLGDGLGGFASQQTFTIGNGPADICYGMFDSDDNYDIVGANLEGNSIALLTGDGAGGFVLSNTISLGIDYKPYAITNGDFDKDGNMDVAFASGGFPYVGVLYGNGLGEFSNLENYTVGGSIERFDIVTEDFNKDGDLDIAVPNSDDDTISVLLGDGAGGFGPQQTFVVGAYPVGICDGDFNADGNFDLAVTNAFDNTVSILLGDGAGGFAAHQILSAGDGPVGILSGNIDYIRESNLDCDGSIHWKRITPGAQIIDEFQIGNIGEVGSFLNWEIESYPTWGSWNFSEDNGILPDGTWISVQVFITAPYYAQTEFTGTIKLTNENDPSDSCEIVVTVETPRSNSLLQSILNLLFERFPNMFPVLRMLLEI